MPEKDAISGKVGKPNHTAFGFASDKPRYSFPHTHTCYGSISPSLPPQNVYPDPTWLQVLQHVMSVTCDLLLLATISKLSCCLASPLPLKVFLSCVFLLTYLSPHIPKH